jgi:hypothetical protein
MKVQTFALLTAITMVGHQSEVPTALIGSLGEKQWLYKATDQCEREPYHVEVDSFVRRPETTRRVNVDSGSNGTMYTGATSIARINWTAQV